MTRTLVKSSLITSLLLAGYFQSICAVAETPSSGWFVGASGSWNWASVANSASVANGSGSPPPSDSDLYTISKPSSQAGFALYGGYRFVRAERAFPAYSFAFRYTHTLQTSVRGVVEQYSLATFTNYNYTLNFNSDIYSIEAKVDLYQFGSFSPYVNFGVGIVNNNVYNYRETAVSGVTPRVNPAFDQSSDNGFAYNLGIGIDYQMTQKLWASLGYEYANLDKISGTAKGDGWVGQSLSLGTLKNNTLLLSVFYQIA